MVTTMTLLCQKIWDKKEWPDAWAQLLIIPIPKKGDLKNCNNYTTISLISHPSKIMLRIILNQLDPIAENIITEEQAGFKKKRSTIELMLNCRIMAEKHIEYGTKLYHHLLTSKRHLIEALHIIENNETLQYR